VLVSNGGFESGLTGWTVTGPGLVASTATIPRLVGSQCVALAQTTADQDAYLGQSLGAVPARAKPVLWTVSAWAWVGVANTGYAYADRGLYLLGTGSSTREAFAPINASTPTGQWIRLEASLVVPAGAADSLEVRLYCPQGAVYWDQVRVFREQKVGAAAGEDYNVLAQRLFEYGAGIGTTGGPGTDVFGPDIGKKSLNMGFSAGAAAGAMPADRYHALEDNESFLTALQELPARDVLDFEVVWNAAGTSRTFKTFAPRKGSYKPANAFELGKNILAFRYDVDGSQTANDVRVVQRNIAAVAPLTLTLPTEPYQLEAVISPPQEVDYQGVIDLQAKEQVRLASPLKVPAITVPAADVMGQVVVGDTVPVRIDYGWVQENANRRIVAMTLRPGAETVELVVN